VLAILVTGWLFAALSADPWRAMGMSVAGTALGFAIWIGFYALGAIGAGDVKFFAAAGAWLGPSLTWRAALFAAVVGGMLAVVMLLLQKRLGTVLHRLGVAVATRTVPGAIESAESSGKNQQLPYGVALAVGALLAAWFPRLSETLKVFP
jgi:prepilin peptidase CpaA